MAIILIMTLASFAMYMLDLKKALHKMDESVIRLTTAMRSVTVPRTNVQRLNTVTAKERKSNRVQMPKSRMDGIRWAVHQQCPTMDGIKPKPFGAGLNNVSKPTK